ncbi:MAG: shikimate dehydrogenase [Firmicutes bacterium]|nr:shikimate dehydrogenase [Bacillota bacterium]
MSSLIIKGDTEVLAVFGDPVSHSLSPIMHNAAFRALGLNCVYIPCRVSSECLKDAVLGIKAFNFKGVNITIPHKQGITGELDEIFGDSLLSGSVNTVINRNGMLLGTSTDGIGLITSLREEAGFEVAGKRVLILGAGGSARAVIYRLIAEGVESITLLNRTIETAVELRENLLATIGFPLKIGDYNQLSSLAWDSLDLVINATSVGLKNQYSLIPPQLLHSGLFVYDLVYHSGGATTLIKEAINAGCHTLSGLALLLYQGAESFRLWFDMEPPINVMREALTVFK